MYERFTDRARKAMQLANQEANRLGFEYVDTHHVLLGILKEGSGVAATVLREAGIDLRAIRDEAEKLTGPSQGLFATARLPHTPSLKRAVDAAVQSARDLADNYVGTEHVLFGLMRADGIAGAILAKCGCGEESLKAKLLGLRASRHQSPTASSFSIGSWKLAAPPTVTETLFLVGTVILRAGVYAVYAADRQKKLEDVANPNWAVMDFFGLPPNVRLVAVGAKVPPSAVEVTLPAAHELTFPTLLTAELLRDTNVDPATQTPVRVTPEGVPLYAMRAPTAPHVVEGK